MTTLTPKDFSPADWEALRHLRLVGSIRIDEAGKHAESLERLTKAELIEFDGYGTHMPWAEVTEAQKALGFIGTGGTGIGGVVYASAPHWHWPHCMAPDDSAQALLREHEGRKLIEIDWENFCDWIEERFEKEGWPTIAEIAKRYGQPIEDTVDWADRQYWASRGGGGRGPIETHVVELEGE